MRLSIGSQVADYRIERFLDSGGMAEVYEATEQAQFTHRRVALKVISDAYGTPTGLERFRREALAATAIEHPGIVPVYRGDVTPDGLAFIAMRYVAGPNLRSYVRNAGHLEVRQTLTILGQIAKALDAAHAAGVMHRDIKPANVLLDDRDGEIRAYLSDFGIAKLVAESTDITVLPDLTQPNMIIGTADFMAPEQTKGGRVTRRTDIYAFGCLAYYCLTGAPPYEFPTRSEIYEAHRHAPIPVPSGRVDGIPKQFDETVRAAMAKDPGERPASASAALELLKQGGGTTIPDPERTRDHLGTPPPRHPPPRPTVPPRPSRLTAIAARSNRVMLLWSAGLTGGDVYPGATPRLQRGVSWTVSSDPAWCYP